MAPCQGMHRFSSPSPNARGAKPWLLSDGERDKKYFKMMKKNLNSREAGEAGKEQKHSQFSRKQENSGGEKRGQTETERVAGSIVGLNKYGQARRDERMPACVRTHMDKNLSLSSVQIQVIKSSRLYNKQKERRLHEEPNLIL